MINKTALSIAGVAEETGQLLMDYLEARGVYDPRGDGMVCYGSARRGKNTLNYPCGSDKIERLKIMSREGVRVIPWFEGKKIPQPHESGLKFPMLARKRHGYGGTDIVPVFQASEVAWRCAAGWDWFSSYVPVANEFRVWVFRGKLLDTYEKIMKRPGDYRYIGRNFRNGFDFELVSSTPSNAASAAYYEAKLALAALNLDFGAVDLLRGEDGQTYVLEVNTAPGVIKSGAEATLGRLADCIADWVKAGYPDTNPRVKESPHYILDMS